MGKWGRIETSSTGVWRKGEVAEARSTGHARAIEEGDAFFQACPGLLRLGSRNGPQRKVSFSLSPLNMSAETILFLASHSEIFFQPSFLIYLSESSRSVDFSNTTEKQRADPKSGKKRVSPVNSHLLHDGRKLRNCGPNVLCDLCRHLEKRD